MTGESPFATVFIHGMVRDELGRKMSKSLNNGIDPLIVIEEFGADALRFALIAAVSLGNDMRFSEEKVKSARNFCNKVWNATRFVLMNLPESFTPGLPESLAMEDKWVISKYNLVIKEVTDNLEKFELGVALQKLYDFIWDIYCDWYIELTKTRVNQGGATAENAQRALVHVLEGTLRLLHPFMPFITEELWQAIPHEGESVMVASWPVYDPALSFEKEERQFSAVMDVISGVRQRRSEMNVPPSKKAKLYITTDHAGVFAQAVPFLQRLAFASEVEIETGCEPEGAVQVITSEARVFIPMSELVDLEKEAARLKKELEATEKEIAALEAKLSNEGFTAKAPANVVAAERERLGKAKEKLAKINESLGSLQKQ
jgi:valyl-tRNA synthetase